MPLLRRPFMGGGGGVGGGGGERGLRRADSLPRPLPVLAPRASLAKTESVKKRDKKKGSRRARLRAGISAALRELHLTGHRARRGGVEGAAVAAAPAGILLVAAADTDTESDTCLPAAAGADARTGGRVAVSGHRRGWAPAVALLLVLVCVVALGRGPAICCCTCAAWWYGGCTDPAFRQRRGGGGRPSSVRPQAVSGHS